MTFLRANNSNALIACSLVVAMLGLSDPCSAESELQIEEVIVTAEKRSKPLREVSQSVSVFDRDELESFHSETLVDLNALAPGVNIAKNEGVRNVVTIRGVGNEANQNAIANPSVSLHVDGIYVASSFALLTDLLDIERIEFLRGPQGSLFGQNSTGGVINVTTAAPSKEEVSGDFAASLGNYDLLKVKGYANLPLGQNAAIRTTASMSAHKGFSQNVILNQELDDNGSLSARARLLWDLNPKTRLMFNAHLFDEDINGSALKGILDTTPNPRSLAQDYRSSYTLSTSLFSTEISREFSTSDFKYLVSLQEDHHISFRDNDRTDLASLGSAAPLPAAVAPEDDVQTTITHEVQWLSADDVSDKISWIGGFFLLDTSFDLKFYEQIDFGLDGSFDPITVQQVQNFELGDYGFISDSTIERNSWSVYVEGDYEISTRIAFIGGFRYTDDQVDGRVTNFYGRSGTAHLQITSRRLTGRTTIEYQTEDNSLIYGSFARGFKPGGSNLTYGREDLIAPILVLPTFVDEVADVVEVGIKTDAFQGRALVNASAFVYDYKNMQYQATDPEVFEGGVANIPSVSISGVEFEIFTVPSSNTELEIRLSRLHSEISHDHWALDNVESDTTTNALLAQGFPLFGEEIQKARAENIKNVKGNELAKAPSFTGNVSFSHYSDVRGIGELRTKIQYVFRGEYFHRIFNNPRTDFVASYSVLNASMRLTMPRTPWVFTLSALNITDEVGVNSKFTDVFGVGATSVELIAPRQLILRFERQFGY